MAQRKKKKREEAGGAPGWMVTYGDLMSLLLTFFVLLLSFSTISEEQFEEALMSLRGALGVLERDTSVIRPMQPNRRTPRSPRELERLAIELQRLMQIADMDKEVAVEMDYENGGLNINLPNSVLFDSASAELKEEAYPILNDVVNVIRDIPGLFVEVRGHTDSRPLTGHPLFADNWDLSYFRAKNVMDFMRQAGQLDVSNFEAIACGSSQPVASEDTPEGMQANRRVELFVRGNFSEQLRDDLMERINQYLGPPAEGEPTTTEPVGVDVEFQGNTVVGR